MPAEQWCDGKVYTLTLNIQVYQALSKPLYLMPPAVHHGSVKANKNQLGNYCHWFVATG